MGLAVWDEQTFRQMYWSAPDGDDAPTAITYGREFFARTDPGLFSRRADRLSPLLVGHVRILIVGCAFGYLVEELRRRRYNAAGVDSSPWISQTTSERADVPLIFSDVRDVVGRHWDVVVTESSIEGSGEDLPAVLDACDRLGDRVVHLITSGLTHPAFADFDPTMIPSHHIVLDA